MLVQNFERRIGIELIVVAAVHAHALTGQCNGIHIVKIALCQPAGKIDDVADGKVGADILREDLRVLRDLGKGDRLHALLCQCFQEILLYLRAADVSRGVTVAVAAKLDGVRTVERLPAFLQVDIQILRRVVIVHVHRHFDINAADHIDNLLKSLQINHYIAVRPYAKGVADLVAQSLNSLLAHAG